MFVLKRVPLILITRNIKHNISKYILLLTDTYTYNYSTVYLLTEIKYSTMLITTDKMYCIS